MHECSSSMSFFFFSSRRRHTRCLSDWSSDVCSSDLLARRFGGENRERGGNWIAVAERDQQPAHAAEMDRREEILDVRSEERRVGKECRSRGWAKREKKKQQVVTSGRRALK